MVRRSDQAEQFAQQTVFFTSDENLSSGQTRHQFDDKQTWLTNIEEGPQGVQPFARQAVGEPFDYVASQGIQPTQLLSFGGVADTFVGAERPDDRERLVASHDDHRTATLN